MKNLIPLVFIFAVFQSIVPAAHAQDVNLRNSTSPYNQVFDLKPQNYITTFVNILFGFAGVISFIFLLVGGIQWITAGGDKDAIEKARKKIIQALIGLAIVFSAYVVIYVLEVLFNINLRQFNLPNL